MKGRTARFHTTRWSLVRATGGEDSVASREALAHLCEAYWYPLYVYIRRQGRSAEDAEDLTQAFIARLIERHDVATARPDRGRFRTFLLGALKHFLINDRRDRRALKRGGGIIPVSLETEHAEGRYRREPADDRTPELLFERRWALTVIERALHGLRVAWERDGRGEKFLRLQACLTSDLGPGGYAALGRGLGMSEGAVKVAVHRLKRDFGRSRRDEVAKTVDEAMVDEEVKALFGILSR